MFNTIILKKGEEKLTRSEWKKFEKGDTIWGDCSSPEELARWDVSQDNEAKAELAKYRCSYKEDGQLFKITEYALEYCECDDDGEFYQGSDFDLAEEEEIRSFKIYRNYGVLSAEKRNTYTYGCEHFRATCSDEIEVNLLKNPWFSIYENGFGDLMVETSWGWRYNVNDVLQGDEKPCFYAIDKDGNGHRVYLEEL